MLLDKFQNKYIIEGTLVAESPIHIGTGNNDFTPTSTDNPVIRDKYGNPFIPGTSLKGVIRSFMERLLASGIFDFTGCDIVSNPCVSTNSLSNLKKEGKETIKQLKEERTEKLKTQNISEEEKKNIIKNYDLEIAKKERESAAQIYESQCDICKLFGSNGFASKIKIADCNLKDDEKVLIQKRDGVAIDRDTLTAAEGKKYDFEAIEQGTKFSFSMTVDNLEDKHKELLRIILSLLEKGELYIGGKTSAGLGNISLSDIKIYRIADKDKFKQYLLGRLDKDLFEEGLSCLEK